MKIIFLILGLFFSMCCFAQKSPSSISVVTGSYTVPAKKYVRAIVNIEGTGTFTINGATALRSTQVNVLTSSVLRVNNQGGGTSLSTGLLGGSTVDTGAAFSFASDQKPIVAEVFLPSGTVINGTGTWRAIIELYER